MTSRIALDNYYVVLYSILTVVLALFINMYIYLKAKKTQLLYYYILTQMMIVLWTLSKVFKTAAPNIEVRWFFIIVQYLAICLLSIFFFLFAYIYRYKRPPKFKYVIVLVIPPFISFLFILTNPLHMSFYSYFDMYKDSFGRLFYIHQSIIYSYLIGGGILCSKDFYSQIGHKKTQIILFTLAISIPLAVNFLYVFKVLKNIFNIRLPMDITPISCGLSLLIFAFAALKYSFLDITPIGYRQALKQMENGILILNKNGEILEFNKSLEQMLTNEFFLKRGQCICDFFDCMKRKKLIEQYIDISMVLQGGKNYSETILRINNGEIIKIIARPVFDRFKRPVGGFLRFINITSLENMVEELSQKNTELENANKGLKLRAEALRQLTIDRVRSFMAKEAHDVLGHSVVLVVSMLEVALINAKKRIQDIETYLDNSIIILRESLAKIENSVRQNSREHNGNIGLIKSIELMANQFDNSGVKIEFTIQGPQFELVSMHTENVFKICREAVTNSVRHGKASLINVILRFSSSSYTLYIIDNGIGCSLIRKGMGIFGMEERAKQLGGNIKYGAYSDGGFSIQLSVEVSD